MERDQSLVNIGGGANDNESLQVVANNLKTMIQTGSNDAAAAVKYEMNRRPGLFGLMFPGRILDLFTNHRNDKLKV